VAIALNDIWSGMLNERVRHILKNYPILYVMRLKEITTGESLVSKYILETNILCYIDVFYINNGSIGFSTIQSLGSRPPKTLGGNVYV
jgi:hypothetical protein